MSPEEAREARAEAHRELVQDESTAEEREVGWAESWGAGPGGLGLDWAWAWDWEPRLGTGPGPGFGSGLGLQLLLGGQAGL